MITNDTNTYFAYFSPSIYDYSSVQGHRLTLENVMPLGQTVFDRIFSHQYNYYQILCWEGQESVNLESTKGKFRLVNVCDLQYILGTNFPIYDLVVRYSRVSGYKNKSNKKKRYRHNPKSRNITSVKPQLQEWRKYDEEKREYGHLLRGHNRGLKFIDYDCDYRSNKSGCWKNNKVRHQWNKHGNNPSYRIEDKWAED